MTRPGLLNYFGPIFSDDEYVSEFNLFLERLSKTMVSAGYGSVSLFKQILEEPNVCHFQPNQWSRLTYVLGPYAINPVFEFPQATVHTILQECIPCRTTFICPLWPEPQQYHYHAFQVVDDNNVLIMPLFSPSNELYLFMFRKPIPFDNMRLNKLPVSAFSSWIQNPHCYWHFAPLNLNRSFFPLANYLAVVEAQTDDAEMERIDF